MLVRAIVQMLGLSDYFHLESMKDFITIKNDHININNIISIELEGTESNRILYFYLVSDNRYKLNIGKDINEQDALKLQEYFMERSEIIIN